MLKLKLQYWPFTEGIFRKSASIKSCRALKEKLNSGDKVNLDDESVLVVASVLKDFLLRNIQGSIFSASLYDKWLDVIDQGNEEEKMTATQRLLDQLPRANVVFLRYLFGMLHNIEQHSSTNQMTAYNLSVCIAPSILCLLNSGSSEIENRTKKISFIQFLIENCLKIFGEDITSLFGENSVSCGNSDITDKNEKVAVCPLETAHCAYSGVTAFSTQQSHQCGTLANGHEHPYGIKMSAVPATGLLQQGLEDCTSASALQEAFLEGPQEIQDQLILKPKHSARKEARNQQEKDPEKKTVSKSSVKKWPFRCTSRTPKNNQHPTLPATKPKQLFGAPFEDLCDNDTLPTPILNKI
ncbi:rho GTPase-activating protein 20-like [Moschus berezovskii]|uniref:rho GTPase-activating protein 20-like n=1 Tax=Moschus berezovskii TaxID=68408 RepID=UPI002444B72C|nr:rho GTPase-activating protein 20-like [Moschus berezovskii]